MDENLLNIFKSAFNVEVKNRVEIQDDSLLVYLDNSVVTVEINKMFQI